MSMVGFFPIRGTKAEIDATSIKDGQFLLETDQEDYNKIYADIGTDRIQVGGTNSIDSTLSTTSTNAVQNKVVTEKLNNHTHTFSAITDKPSSYPPSSHNHNDLYYSRTAINLSLSGKQEKLVRQIYSVTTNGNWCIVQKEGYTLISAYNMRDDASYFVKGINRAARADGEYILLIDGLTGNTEIRLYLVWALNQSVIEHV